jgi:hypothetical protein
MCLHFFSFLTFQYTELPFSDIVCRKAIIKSQQSEMKNVWKLELSKNVFKKNVNTFQNFRNHLQNSKILILEASGISRIFSI